MTDETLPLDACCKNCKYYIHYTNPAWRICVAPKIIKNGLNMVNVTITCLLGLEGQR